MFCTWFSRLLPKSSNADVIYVRMRYSKESEHSIFLPILHYNLVFFVFTGLKICSGPCKSFFNHFSHKM